jgi:hypothetical protein
MDRAERIVKRLEAGESVIAICLYCGAKYLAAFKGQKYHDPRCRQDDHSNAAGMRRRRDQQFKRVECANKALSELQETHGENLQSFVVKKLVLQSLATTKSGRDWWQGAIAAAKSPVDSEERIDFIGRCIFAKDSESIRRRRSESVTILFDQIILAVDRESNGRGQK